MGSFVSKSAKEKKDRILFICLDPKQLNTHVKKERFPIPVREEISGEMLQGTYLSILDASTGVPLQKNSRHLWMFNSIRKIAFWVIEIFHKYV